MPDDGADKATHSLELQFATTCEYGFAAEGEIHKHPDSATIEEDGAWFAYGCAQHGWGAEYEFEGALRHLHVPDDTDVLLNEEPYEP